MTKIKAILVGVAVLVAYVSGYSSATTKADLEMARYKLDLAESMKSALIKEKERYELKEQELVARYNLDRERSAERMRQLERKLQTSGDVESLKRERDRAIGLAVEGEELLREGERIIEALKN